LHKSVSEIMKLTKEELDYWRARSLVVPIGWMKGESETARLINVISKGRVTFREAFNNPFEPIPEDDPELIAQAQAFIKQGKENGSN